MTEKKEEPMEEKQSLFGRFNTTNISQQPSIFGQQNVIQQGFSKEVRSFLQAEQETNKRSYGYGFSGFPQQNKPKQPKVAIIRNTNIFKDAQSPWTEANEEVKKLFKSEDIQNSIHKFPQSIDNAFACHEQYINNGSGSQYHLNACGKFPISAYYSCYHCSRKQNSEDRTNKFSYVICEDCFQPNLHIGHIYEKTTTSNIVLGSYGSSNNLICICGKDAFLDHPSTYRCSLHCQSREDKIIGQHSQEDMKNQSQLLKTIKSLFEIALYLRKQMQSFENLQKEEHDEYFAMITKIVNKMTNITYKNAKLCLPFYNFLTSQKFMIYKQKNKPFYQSIYKKQAETGKQQQLLMYLLESHQQKPTISLILSLIQNDQVAKQFICKIGEQRHFSINQHILKELEMRVNVLLCRNTLGKLFYYGNNQRIVWLKSEENFKYAVNFISSTIYSYSNRTWDDKVAYSNKMDEILSQFSEIPVCNFMKKICIYLLPELLSCYQRIYSGQEFEEQDDQEQHERQQTRSLIKQWDKKKIKMASLINRLILSLCDCKWQNLQNFWSKITTLSQQYNTHNILEQYHQYHKTPQQKQDKRAKKIEQNFKWYYNDIYSSLKSTFGNIYYIDNNKNNYNDRNKRMNEKIKQLVDVQKILSQCYITYLVCTLLVGGGEDGPDGKITGLFKLDARFRGFTRGNWREEGKGKGEDKWVEEAAVYQLIAMLIFSKFHVPEIWINQLTNNEQKYSKQIKQLIQNHFGTVKNFKPLDLKILKLRLKTKQFKSLVQDNLVYDIPSKTFYYIETKNQPDQIYQLLNWKFTNSNSHLIGVSSLPELRKYLTQPIRRVLISLLVQSKFIRKCKDQIDLMIQTVQKNVGVKNQPFSYKPSKQKAYREISNYYLYYLSYLVILNEVCQGRNEFITKELQDMNSSDSRYLPFMNGKEKSQVDLILFGKQKSQQLSKDKEKRQQKERQIKMEQNQPKSQVQQSSKEKRVKEMKQKGNTILKQQTIQEAKEQVCITCHEGAQPENQLVYLMRCNMNKTVPSTFFKQVNKMNTNLRLCFHALHINCYYKQTKKNCLLCGQFSNCIIPTKYNSKQKQLNRLCLNSLIVAMYQAYKVYNVSNLFIILFKHVIQSKVFNSLINPQLYEQNKKKKHQSELFLQQFLFDMYRQASPETKDQYDGNLIQLRNQCMKVESKTLGKLQIMFVNAFVHKIRNQKILFQMDQLEKLVGKIKKEDFMVVINQIEEIQPNLESAHLEKIHSQNVDNKQQISKQYPLSLPKYAHQLNSFGTQNCFFCRQSKRQGICLICGCTLCRMCSSSSQHSRQHEEKALDFLFEQAKLKFNMSMSKEQSEIYWSSGNQKQIPVYYNHLMIPFREALIFKPLEEDESIELNEKLFYGLAEMLLN